MKKCLTKENVKHIHPTSTKIYFSEIQPKIQVDLG